MDIILQRKSEEQPGPSGENKGTKRKWNNDLSNSATGEAAQARPSNSVHNHAPSNSAQHFPYNSYSAGNRDTIFGTPSIFRYILLCSKKLLFSIYFFFYYNFRFKAGRRIRIRSDPMIFSQTDPDPVIF